MAEIINNDSKTSNTGRRHRWQPRISWRLAAILVALILVAVGIYANANNKNSGSGKYSYRYKSLTATNIKLTALPKGASLPPNVPALADVTVSFKKPLEFQIATGSANTDSSKFRHQLQSQTVASLSILMYTYSGNYGKIVEPVVAASLKKSPQTKDYQSTIAPLNAYVEDNLPIVNAHDYNVSLGPAQSLTTSNIKNTAWQFDVSAVKKTNAQYFKGKLIHKATSPQPYEKWQGKLLYIWTSSHLYYILLDSIQQNWQPNVNTWQQVIDSLQVS